MSSTLLREVAPRGASFTEVAGREIVRHHGDPAAEYAAVRDAVGAAVRTDLVPIRMWGRDPLRMLHGLVTSDLLRLEPGAAAYAAMLNPKGRVVAELRALPLAREQPELLLLVPAEALQGATGQLTKYVPPLFARWEECSGRWVVLGAYGPEAAGVVARVTGAEPTLDEDRFLETGPGEAPILVVATREAGGEPGFDLVVPVERAEATWAELLACAAERGGRAIGWSTLETLRVEAGRPRAGAELTEETIATEAYEAIGWVPRAISFGKGCYTGQEVIVRIAHRGHVNRHLRGLVLGDVPAPTSGTRLHHPQSGKEVGRVTSAAVSPLMGATIAMAFVRREVAPGDRVRLDGEGRAEGLVVELPFSPAHAAGSPGPP